MTISNARWLDPEKSCVLATIDAREISVPPDLLNRHYAEMLRQGITIAES